ncbi:MAG: TetR/AcrR family transcriptional regulator [Actinomycetia bacterium]|nr:TetR/AcrR family transcriptional regulator [Actinomycetes bacterium]MCP4959776.1 TetR/AcrR family transcriptional regulator [Actinomycetes bacterium]
MNDNRQRVRLNKQLVLEGAIDLADQTGIEALTIRRLAEFLGVKPMSLYHHVPSKDEIVDGMVDIVFTQIDLPPDDLAWRDAMKQRCVSARQVLNRHPWAPPLMESRTNPGPASLRHHDAVIRCLLKGGLSFELTAHAYAIIDSYVYGFALQEAHLPFGGGEEISGLAEEIMSALPIGQYPHLAEFTTNVALKPGYSFGASFEFGLDLILEGLTRAGAK